MTATRRPTTATGDRPSRSYDVALRREQAAATRERIVAAGSELLHTGSIRDWKRLTVRAVAERAGVSERTIYRHFGNERGLRDAVMHRLEHEAGIDLVGMTLGDVATVAAQIFDHVASYPIEPRPRLDATLVDANERQKEALLGAVAAVAGAWPEERQVLAAALCDVLWSVETYERLVGDWHIDHQDAVDGVTWIIGLVDAAIRADRGPR